MKSAAPCALGATCVLLIVGCGGGGGGSGSFDSHAELLAVTFPDPNGVNAQSVDAPPTAAPLVQQIVFTFSGRPDPDRISANTLPIRDRASVPADGTYSVQGSIVTFTPVLPLRPATLASDGNYDGGGAGLVPGESYTIRVSPNLFSFVASVAPSLLARFKDPSDPKGVLISFKTTLNAVDYFAGLDARSPALVSADPADGATGVSPDLYTDPDHQFAPRRSFFLRFDRPLRPDLDNVGDATFRLIDLDDPATHALALGCDVKLVANELDRALVEIAPSGILPFSHLLALEYPADLHGLSQSGPPSGTTAIATAFTIAAAPSTTVHDLLVENFDSNARQETDPSQFGLGNLPADWNQQGSGILQASFAFQGDGVLGEFHPPQPPAGTTRIVYLDTAEQVFPLPDGSTPNAPPNFVVRGGVFSFTDIDIPDGVIVKPLGSNPLVITAIGDIHIAGDIDLSGGDGTPENAYDSAVTSVPGGQAVAGGGRGGEGQPIFFYPPDQISYLNLVSPLTGGTGYGIDPADGIMKRIGGTGGVCGCLDHKDANGKYSTDQELVDCHEFRNGNDNEKIAGGGGGSMYKKGDAPGLYDRVGGTRQGDANGIANVRPDGTGKFYVLDDTKLPCGQAGQHPFADDGDANNDFYGTRGQLRRLIGGEGGGGGGSLTESYYCGVWCDHDDNPDNDNNCKGSDFGDPPTRGDSVGDACGGGAGAGGGALLMQALGAIEIDSQCLIDASGGLGKGGEGLGCSYWGGGGGGGAGGMIVLQSATSIFIHAGALLDVRFGSGDKASSQNDYYACDDGALTGNAGDGGPGGDGLVQLQVPAGQTATVVAGGKNGSIQPSSSWIDATNTLNPVEFSSKSVAVSRWFDLGRTTQRLPLKSNPVFSFRGVDSLGYVKTDASGNVVTPDDVDVVCGYLGQIDPVTHLYKLGETPRADFIPKNATVRVEFQSADPIEPGSKEIDPNSIKPAPGVWSATAATANGHQFIRWRIAFDITADGSQLAPGLRLPTVESIQVHADF